MIVIEKIVGEITLRVSVGAGELATIYDGVYAAELRSEKSHVCTSNEARNAAGEAVTHFMKTMEAVAQSIGDEK